MSRLPALGPRGEGWVVIQFALLWLIVALGVGEGGAWSREARFATTAIAAVLLLGGGVLAIRGVLDLRGALTPLPRPRADAQLVESGSYRLVRHPVYGGIIIGAAGWALLAASPSALLGTAVLLGFFRLKSGREEQWLRERYPAYDAYAAHTRRMLPGIY